MTFERLFALIIMGHGRRQLLWFAVTGHPTPEWLAQQIIEAFPWDTALAFPVRDNDGCYKQALLDRLRSMGIRDRPTAPDRLGKIHMWNGSSARSAASASIMF